MERLEKKLNRIYNKCKKFGCEFSYRRVGEDFREIGDESGHTYTAKFILVEAEGRAIINGWGFLASIEHTEKGNIVKCVGETEIPEKYYNSEPLCEHCNYNRNRKDTYLVINEETGEIKQVGKSCLKDFTGGLDAGAVAHYISLFDELIVGETPPGGRGERYYRIDDFLRYAAETVRCFGYVSRSDDPHGNTADRAFEYFLVENHGYLLSEQVREALLKEMKTVNFNAHSEDTDRRVGEALSWALALEPNNNYQRNLKTVCSLKYVTYKNMGILTSLFSAHHRALERQQEETERQREKDAERARSEHVGQVGDRITVQPQSTECLTSWETEWGITRVYKIIDINGNVYTWKTGSFIEEGVKHIKGTVKEHKEYDGMKQTELTRCRLSG
jgi:hypothetical protein